MPATPAVEFVEFAVGKDAATGAKAEVDAGTASAELEGATADEGGACGSDDDGSSGGAAVAFTIAQLVTVTVIQSVTVAMSVAF